MYIGRAFLLLNSMRFGWNIELDQDIYVKGEVSVSQKKNAVNFYIQSNFTGLPRFKRFELSWISHVLRKLFANHDINFGKKHGNITEMKKLKKKCVIKFHNFILEHKKYSTGLIR